MKTVTISQFKDNAGKIVDQVLKGEPCVIVRGNKMAVLQIYELPDFVPPVPKAGRWGGTDRDRNHLLEQGKKLPKMTEADEQTVAQVVKAARKRK